MAPTTDTPLGRVLASVDGARQYGTRWQARCPAHDDHKPSLSIQHNGHDRVLLFCHGGCSVADVVAAMNLTMADLFDDRAGSTYRYGDGRTVFRSPDKQFRQSGKTKADRGTAELYRLDRVKAAVAAHQVVYIVEGESDVHAVEVVGATATCSPSGAGKWHLVDPSPLFGADVRVIQDKDAPGRKHAAQVMKSLTGKAHSLQLLEAAEGKDAADHLTAGHGLDDFVVISAPAKPEMLARRGDELDDVEPPSWLCVGHIPDDSITVLAGDEGLGKSLWWVMVVAHLTTGRPLPEIGLPAGPARDVIVVFTEDTWAEVRARLVLAGADLHRLHVVSENADGTGTPIFPGDMQVVENAATDDLALVIVDAWLDTVPQGLRVRDPQDARTALHPWREFAASKGCAVLLLVNTNRLTDASLRDRIGATGSLRQKGRMMQYAAARDGEEGQRLLVGPDKANGIRMSNAVEYTIDVVGVRTATEHDPGTTAMLAKPVVTDKWIRHHVEDWRAEKRRAEKDASAPPTADDRAEKWLRQFFAAHSGGPVEAASVKAAVGMTGHSWTRVGAVFSAIGGIKRPTAPGSSWVWTLDPESEESEETDTPRHTGKGSDSGEPPDSESPPVYLRRSQTSESSDTGLPNCQRCSKRPLLSPQSQARGYCETCRIMGGDDA